jgi:predicted nucleic acid-binding protein
VIAVDSSVLIRYLTNDDPALAKAAAEVIDGEEPVGVSAMVLLETVHVLRGRAYGLENPAVTEALVELLQHQNVHLLDLDADLACAAMLGVRHLSARHLADALISACASQAGADALVTNDRKFSSRLVPIRQLGPS